MPEDDPDRVDPRYDPAFQRGYAGEVRMGQRGESALRRTSAVTSAPGRVDAGQQAVPIAPTSEWSSPTAAPAAAPEPLAGSSPATDASTGPAPAPRDAMGGDPVAVPEPASARDATRNPFYLAAAALAVLLIVGGAVWLNQGFAAIADDRTSTTVGYYAAMAMSFGAPLIIGIGVAIIAALLFALARNWRPRDEES